MVRWSGQSIQHGNRRWFHYEYLLEKRELLERGEALLKKMDKNKSIRVHGSMDSLCVLFYPVVALDDQNVRCVKIKEHGEPKLVSLKEVKTKSGCLTAILKAGKIVKKQKNEYMWKMSIVECELKELPKDYEGYFKKMSKCKMEYL